MIRVADGDTIVVRLEGSEKVERVRYLGIDTPETVHPRKPVEPGGPEAAHLKAAEEAAGCGEAGELRGHHT